MIVKKPSYDSRPITELVISFVKTGKNVTDVGAELSYIIPSNASQHFPKLFDSLEGEIDFKCKIIQALL